MYLNFPNPPMPPTSTEAPSQAEVTGRTLKRWGIDQAAVAAKAAVGCASNPAGLNTLPANVATDVALSNAQLVATLPVAADSFTPANNLLLPTDTGTQPAPVDTTAGTQALPAPYIWPQTLGSSDQAILSVQGLSACNATVARIPRPSLPCGQQPPWDSHLVPPTPAAVAASAAGKTNANPVLAWIRANPSLTVAIFGGVFAWVASNNKGPAR